MGESDTFPKRSDWLERGSRFIKDVGFPIAVAVALLAYMWFIGRATNDYLAKGTDIMERAIKIIERLEKKLP